MSVQSIGAPDEPQEALAPARGFLTFQPMQSKLRAWWSERQGLDGSLEGASPADVLERSGWSRSVGGVGPYLTLFSRAGTSRAAADKAVADLEICELPAARGCTYVLPASDFALGLLAGREMSGGDLKSAKKLGVTDHEIDALGVAVRKALSKGPLAPDAIREAVGPAARSLGEAGKKKGVTTTLPLALGQLQTAGEIRRVPVNGRLDQQRYQYALWKPNPLGKSKLSREAAYTELARRYFRWVGPATPAEFQWFSGLGVKTAQAATEPLGLVPGEPGSDRLLLPEDAAAFRKFKPTTKPHYVLVSSLDSISAHRRNVVTLLDPADLDRQVVAERGLAAVSSFADLPSHAILDRGRVVGFWEYDADAEEIVSTTFGIKDKGLDAAIERMETFVRDQLGDARSFSLDSPKSRAPKIKALRALRR
ncbi:MAG: crosslink repair DNA glycosylase YcaQ family protein [Gemmatimonadota bacterium]